MISFNEKDLNLTEISKLVELSNARLSYEYRVYGLGPDNPAILVENYNINFNFGLLNQFFNSNGISFASKHLSKGKFHIYIGLREDIRKNAVLCAKIIRTIVLFLENKIEDFKANLKINVKKYPLPVEKPKEKQTELKIKTVKPAPDLLTILQGHAEDYDE